ncbi:hypothetical protein ADH68_02205 [Muribaculum intestinale]|nr:hypothetical protein ADH68_02205 [Muribaculum intestinale]
METAHCVSPRDIAIRSAQGHNFIAYIPVCNSLGTLTCISISHCMHMNISLRNLFVRYKKVNLGVAIL